jgi:hypothetical protein
MVRAHFKKKRAQTLVSCAKTEHKWYWKEATYFTDISCDLLACDTTHWHGRILVPYITTWHQVDDHNLNPLHCGNLKFSHTQTATVQGVAMNSPEWFYCKQTCIPIAYWEVSPSKYSPWAAMHLAQWCCHHWKYFWNSCCEIAFSALITFLFGYLQYLEIFIPLMQPLFLETTRNHLEPIRGTGWVFNFSNQFLA